MEKENLKTKNEEQTFCGETKYINRNKEHIFSIVKEKKNFVCIHRAFFLKKQHIIKYNSSLI